MCRCFEFLAEIKSLSLSANLKDVGIIFSVYLQFIILFFRGFFYITSPVSATERASRFKSFTYRIKGEGMPQPPGTAVFPPVCQQAAVWTGAPLGGPSPRSVRTGTSRIKQSAEPLLQTYSDSRRSCVCLTPPQNTHAPIHTCGQSKHTYTGFSSSVATQAVRKLLCLLIFFILILFVGILVVIRTSVWNRCLFNSCSHSSIWLFF